MAAYFSMMMRDTMYMCMGMMLMCMVCRAEKSRRPLLRLQKQEVC